MCQGNAWLDASCIQSCAMLETQPNKAHGDLVQRCLQDLSYYGNEVASKQCGVFWSRVLLLINHKNQTHVLRCWGPWKKWP